MRDFTLMMMRTVSKKSNFKERFQDTKRGKEKKTKTTHQFQQQQVDF